GVDAIVHTMSPVNLSDGDPEKLIVPAVKGTVGILNSALKHSNSVKRVVFMLSCTAILQIEPEPKVFSELDWNKQAPKLAKKQGRAVQGITKYRASKALTERASWDFVEQHKSESEWDFVALNPPYIFGPMIHEVSTPTALGLSAAQFHTRLTQPSTPDILQSGNCWIDVRDLAHTHVLALLRALAGGKRIIIDAGPFVWQNWLDAVPNSPKFQKGACGAGKDAVHRIRYDPSKSARVLGMSHRSIEETARDIVADWEARGW
ncbi:hypothetical protein B0H14DRAFT_2348539, partial [Mycena olivaceomarginata]